MEEFIIKILAIIGDVCDRICNMCYTKINDIRIKKFYKK